MPLWVFSSDGMSLTDVYSGAEFSLYEGDGGQYGCEILVFSPTRPNFGDSLVIFGGTKTECRNVLRQISQSVCKPQSFPLAFGEGTKRQPDDDDPDDDDDDDFDPDDDPELTALYEHMPF